MIKNGQSLISNNFDLTYASGNSSAVQARIEAAQRKVQYLNAPQRGNLLSGSLSGTQGEELAESFLTMSKTGANDIYKQYMAQINEVQKQEPIYNKSILSPISETNSSKYQTIDSQGQTIKRGRVPEEERKLTGTGAYNIEEYEYDHDYYSDDFESDEESSESNSSSIMTSGCSGSTADNSAQRQAKAVTRANQD